jgi:ABC-type branched-subunit amino acid transport system ATPase component
MNFGKPLGVGTPQEMLDRADVAEAFLGVTL